MSTASKVVLVLAVVAVGGLWYWRNAGGGPSAVSWRLDPQEAFAAAAAEDKPVLIRFEQAGCPPCRALQREVFADPAIGRQVHESFVPLSVDVRGRVNLRRRFGVTSTPQCLIAAADGAPLLGPVGPPAEGRREWFERFMKTGLARFARRRPKHGPASEPSRGRASSPAGQAGGGPDPPTPGTET